MKEKVGLCHYNPPNGCLIPDTKPPICLGYICQDLEEHVMENAKDKRIALKFLIGLSRIWFKGGLNEPAPLFEDMDNVIGYGNELVISQKQKFYKPTLKNLI